ncbi:glycerate kinase [Cryobacterium adonitolivorans]|uniref:Glycerate kinase n=1 Tax=Cryobacterium adonitolivorans TaxID=1259189 RepID=A0A4R8WBC4_9MICO|nr:glycerate kinase [Cryobacterium adonitolivorans]TFC05621.1 glycerate kinase [Cryobacterium adonitolivorans]
MKFVLAPDSFKESMTATEAVAAMKRGVLSVFPDADCVGAPMADGGEGTTEVLADALGGVVLTAPVHDALGRPVQARYGYVDSQHLAIIEIAAAAGIDLVAVADRDPKAASSYGVGELIGHALDHGATRFIVGLGGSVTNDGGAGMLEALGARLLDDAGADLPRGGAALARLHRIDLAAFDPRLAGTTVQIASDVTNPLLGATGASAVFGPQKGADPATVRRLDAALSVYAAVVAALTGTDVAVVPGAGAAGGLGAAFLAFFPAYMRRGVDVVMDAVRLADRMAGADFVFTGEGSIDSQTLNGKTPLGVAEVAAVHGVPVIAFAGRIGSGAEALYDHGFVALVPIVQGVSDLPSALVDGAANLERAVATTCRLLGMPRGPATV